MSLYAISAEIHISMAAVQHAAEIHKGSASTAAKIHALPAGGPAMYAPTANILRGRAGTEIKKNEKSLLG